MPNDKQLDSQTLAGYQAAAQALTAAAPDIAAAVLEVLPTAETVRQLAGIAQLTDTGAARLFRALEAAAQGNKQAGALLAAAGRLDIWRDQAQQATAGAVILSADQLQAALAASQQAAQAVGRQYSIDSSQITADTVQRLLADIARQAAEDTPADSQTADGMRRQAFKLARQAAIDIGRWYGRQDRLAQRLAGITPASQRQTLPPTFNIKHADGSSSGSAQSVSALAGQSMRSARGTAPAAQQLLHSVGSWSLPADQAGAADQYKRWLALLSSVWQAADTPAAAAADSLRLLSVEAVEAAPAGSSWREANSAGGSRSVPWQYATAGISYQEAAQEAGRRDSQQRRLRQAAQAAGLYDSLLAADNARIRQRQDQQRRQQQQALLAGWRHWQHDNSGLRQALLSALPQQFDTAPGSDCYAIPPMAPAASRRQPVNRLTADALLIRALRLAYQLPADSLRSSQEAAAAWQPIGTPAKQAAAAWRQAAGSQPASRQRRISAGRRSSLALAGKLLADQRQRRLLLAGADWQQAQAVSAHLLTAARAAAADFDWQPQAAAAASQQAADNFWRRQDQQRQIAAAQAASQQEAAAQAARRQAAAVSHTPARQAQQALAAARQALATLTAAQAAAWQQASARR